MKFHTNSDDNIEAKGLATIRHAVTKNSHLITERSNVIGAFRADETPYVAQENIYLLKNKEDPMQLASSGTDTRRHIQ